MPCMYVFTSPAPNSPRVTLMTFRHIKQTLVLGSHWPVSLVLWWVVCWQCVFWGPGCDGTCLLITALRRLRQKTVYQNPVLLRPCMWKISVFCRGAKYWEQGPFFPHKATFFIVSISQYPITYVVLRAREWGNSNLVFSPSTLGAAICSPACFPSWGMPCHMNKGEISFPLWAVVDPKNFRQT